MATGSTTTPIRNWKKLPPSSTSSAKTPFSSVTKTRKLSLTDWCLIKPQFGAQLGVAGNARKGTVMRVFHSGPIAKRHDDFTLETVDGFTITLVGLINRSRTLQNGIPSEVCDHFVLGFPYDWEERGAQCFGEGSTLASKNADSYGLKPSQHGAKSSLPTSFDDLPVTRVRDLMMLPSGDYTESRITSCLFDHMLSIYGCSLNEENNGQPMTKEIGPSPEPNEERNSPSMTKSSLSDRILRNQVKNKAEQRHKNDDDISDAAPIREVESLSMHNYSIMGVCTRSKKRSRNSSNNLEEGLSPNTSTKPVSLSEAVVINCGLKIVESFAPDVNIDVSANRTIHNQSATMVDVNKQTEDLTPRSKNRSKTPTSNGKGSHLSPKTSTEPVSMNEASGSQCRGTIAETNVSNVSRSAILSNETSIIGETLDSPGVRRATGRRRLGDVIASRGYRSEVSSNKQRENLWSTPINPGIIAQASTENVPEIRCGVSITSKNASPVSTPDKSSPDKMQKTLNSSAARPSNQQKNSDSVICTRSKAKLIRLRSDPKHSIAEVEERVDSAARSSSPNKKVSVLFPGSEMSGSTRRDASSISPREKKETKGASEKCAVRRSKRIRNQKR